MKRTPPSLRRCPSCGTHRHPSQYRVVMVRADGITRRASRCIFCENPAAYAWAEPVGPSRPPKPARPGRPIYEVVAMRMASSVSHRRCIACRTVRHPAQFRAMKRLRLDGGNYRAQRCMFCERVK
jgi:hypothetical protein